MRVARASVMSTRGFEGRDFYHKRGDGIKLLVLYTFSFFLGSIRHAIMKINAKLSYILISKAD